MKKYISEQFKREQLRQAFQEGKDIRVDVSCTEITHIAPSSGWRNKPTSVNTQLQLSPLQIHDLFYEIWDLVGNATLQTWIKSEPSVEFIIK